MLPHPNYEHLCFPTLPAACAHTLGGMRTYQCTLPSPHSAHNNSQTTYEVQYRGVDSPNDVNETFYETVTVSVGMTFSYNIPGLMAYSAYNVSVRATNQYGVGEFSEEVTVRTGEDSKCTYVVQHV